MEGEEKEDIQEDIINVDEFFEKLNDYIRKKDNIQLIQANLYTCISVFCIVLVSYLQANGEKGWSSKILDVNKNQAFSSETQELLEQNFSKATWLLPILQSSFATTPKNNEIIVETGEDISLDEMFEAFTKKMKEQESFWSFFSKADTGLSKWVSGNKENERNPVQKLLLTLLDMFYLSAAASSSTGHETFLRSLLQWIENLITGHCRETTIQFSYYLSPSGTAATILFKYLLHAWMINSPILRNQIMKNMYNGTKKVIINFLLWCIINIPSESIRQPINKAIAKLRVLLKEKSNESEILQKEIEAGSIQLTDLETGDITLNDYYTLQILARLPNILCSDEFQSILVPLKAEPIFRLLLELSDIPVLDTEKYEICSSTEKQAEQQVITEKQEGGVGKKRRCTIRQKRNIKHQTRRSLKV